MKKIIVLTCILSSALMLKAQWTTLSTGVNYNFWSTCFLNSDTGFAAGISSYQLPGSPVLMKTMNGGKDWISIPVNQKHLIESVYFLNADTGFIEGSGFFVKTTDGGKSWNYMNIDSSFYRTYFNIKFINHNVGYTVGSYGSIAKTNNSGKDWTFQTSGAIKDLHSISFPTSQTGFAVGDSGTIVKTSNGGSTWTSLTSGSTTQLWSVYFANSDTGYVVGDSGLILRTYNGGNTWIKTLMNTTNWFVSVYFTNAKTGYLVGWEGTILKTFDAGNNWSPMNSNTTKYLISVFFTNSKTGYAVGNGGAILKTTNGGGCTNISLSVKQSGLSCNSNSTGSINILAAGGVPPYHYSVDSGKTFQYSNIFNNLPLSKYTLLVEDSIHCFSNSQIITLKDTIKLSPPSICLVTVDPTTGKNKIIWEKTTGQLIMAYKIKKESTVAGKFTTIDSVGFSGTSIFSDNSSDPSKHADRYVLTSIDSCGNESDPSPVHQTIHLTISQGLPGSYNLIWTPYVGFDYSTYYIYKGKSASTLKLIDSLSSTYIQYTDTASGVVYYQVGIKKQQPCKVSLLKANEEPYIQSVSNLDDNLRFVSSVTTMNIDSKFNIYPSPYSDALNIEGSLNKPSVVKISIYNMLGTKLYETSTNQPSGNFKITLASNEIAATSGVNILKIETGNSIFYKNIIKK